MSHDPLAPLSVPIRAAAEEADRAVRHAMDCLDGLLPLLGESERSRLRRPDVALPSLFRALAHAASEQPDLARSARFDPELILELLDRTVATGELAADLEDLGIRLGRARAAWSAEAREAARRFRGLAQVNAVAAPELRRVMGALAELEEASPLRDDP